MIILVEVVISVTMKSNLMEIAKNASLQTQLYADKEELISVVASTMDYKTGMVDPNRLLTNLGNDWEKEELNIFKKKSTKNRFIVTIFGKIIELPEVVENYDWGSVGLEGIETNVRYYSIDESTNSGGGCIVTDGGYILILMINNGEEQIAEVIHANHNIGTNPFTFHFKSIGMTEAVILEDGNIKSIVEGRTIIVIKQTT